MLSSLTHRHFVPLLDWAENKGKMAPDTGRPMPNDGGWVQLAHSSHFLLFI